jgi:two-component system NarL family response regulator
MGLHDPRSGRTRILIAEDRPIAREGFKVVFRGEAVTLLVAATSQAAVKVARERRPDVAIVSQGVRPLGGVGTIVRLRSAAPATRTILHLSTESDEDVYRAIRAGARGCLPADVSVAECRDVVRAVQEGRVALPRDLGASLARRMSAEELTAQEERVLRALTDGRSNKEIGRGLGIAEGTVKVHVKRILRKLGVRSRAQAIARTLRNGSSLTEPTPSEVRCAISNDSLKQ